jgi:ATP-binding cassette subfamily E protein 1
VLEILSTKDQRDLKEWAMTELDLNHVGERNIEALSGGELQRFAIAVVVVQKVL